MDCKRALDEAKGDYEKAKKILDEKGILKAEKKRPAQPAQGFWRRMSIIAALACF